MLADELFLLLEGARVTAQSMGPKGFGDRLVRMGEAGNAKGGTPLMQSVQTIGIDLPRKILIWQDEAGGTWLSYNDPSWLAKRHGADHNVEVTITALNSALHALAKAATGAQ